MYGPRKAFPGSLSAAILWIVATGGGDAFGQSLPMRADPQVRPPIEGDRAVFEAVADAHTAMGAKYSHGVMDVEAESGSLDPERPEERLECRFEWDGPNHRVSGRFLTFEPTRDGASHTHEDQVETVWNDKTYQTYTSTQMHLRIREANDVLLPLTRLQPERSWFTINGQPWSYFLRDPAYQARGIERYVVTQPDARTIDVTLVRPGGISFTIRSSLDWDWCVVEFHGSGPGGKSGASGTFDWARDRAGRVVLKQKQEFLRSDKASIYRRVLVKSFDPDTRPPKERFLARIKPPPGTTVEDEIAKKTYRIGDRAVEEDGKRLEELVEVMKAEGFARPRPR